MVYAAAPLLFILTLLLRMVSAVIPITQLWLGKLIIDKVAVANVGNPPDQLLWMLVGGLLAITLAATAIARGLNLAESLLADKFGVSLTLKIMTHSSRLDLASIENPDFHDKLSRAARGDARGSVLTIVARLVEQTLTLSSYVIAVGSYSPLTLFGLCISVVPSFVGEARLVHLEHSLLSSSTPEKRQLDYFRELATARSAAKEVRLFGLAGYLEARVRTLFDSFYQRNRKLAVRKAMQGTILGALPIIVFYAAYLNVVYQAVHQELSIGTLGLLAASFMGTRNALENVFGGLSSLGEKALYLTDLFDLFQTSPSIEAPRHYVGARSITRGLELHDVTFAYPSSSVPALYKVNLRIELGEKVALVGDNGAGKTTLVKLLTRLYDPTSGTISLDGVDLRDYDPAWLRTQIGVILQDYVKYDMLARENIAVGSIENELELDRVKLSAVTSGAASIIDGLPRGYDQMLGRRFESGIDLSGGQWQKIALARAHMAQAQILVMDEPTANLDPAAEYDVYRQLLHRSVSQAVLLISHRFSTVRCADRIYVMRNGKLVEQGSHRELIDKAGRYAELFNMQATGYL